MNLDKEQFMSDGTKSEYTKTGKKVMCINSNRRDLTYKKVYDVFTTQDSVYFIIDDVGDKRYESLEFPYWCEKSDDVVDKANETKHKSKAGDKETGAIKDIPEQYHPRVFLADENDELEDVVVDVNVEDTLCKVRLDKCIELVSDDTKPIENESSPIKSDGGSSSYYAQQIPKGMLERFNTTGTIEAKDVIRLFLGNDFNMGNIFKAYCRITSLRQGKGKAGVDEPYDLTKAKFFAEDELNYYLENKDV